MDAPAKLTEEQFDIAITYDGTWLHQGAKMTRMPLVRLFSAVLKRDAAGDYWLITPVERGRIAVEDAPFVIVTWREEGSVFYLTDNLGREVPVDAAHPLALRVAKVNPGPLIPYHQLGGGIEARLATSVYYDLVERALKAGQAAKSQTLALKSAGVMHPLGIMA